MKPLVVYTPEQVAVELLPAGFGLRFGAFLVDAAILWGILGFIGFAGTLLPKAVSGLFTTTAGFIVLWGYHVAFELLWNGQTPGKRLFKLRVVDGRGLPLEAAQSLVRNIVRLADMMPAGGVGMLAVLLDPHRRRLGDRAAHTLVVHEQQPGTLDLSQVEARRFNSLRTPRLRKLVMTKVGLDDRELLYALCLRAPKLTEQARFELFERVGGHYREALAIEDANLSAEAIVRGIAAVCSGQADDQA
ncbi:MAG TPA: RDD family protein [Myxococcales bacterium]|nr:RDD family protein [Myxococcales bacterium]